MTTIPSASISELLFSGGNKFHFKPTEKIILVGPNNSGKSQSLRDIVSICQNGSNNRTPVIVDLKISKAGTVEDLKSFLETEGTYVDQQYRYKGWQVHEAHVPFWRENFLLHSLLAGFVKIIAANDRLTICDQQLSISRDQQKAKPQHVLYDDTTLMSKISGLFRQAFGEDLMFDFRGGSKLPIHVGQTPVESVDRVSDTYVKAVRTNPLLDQQGDGMKGYAGILFEAIVADLDITLIDEPEAFLHPPQMRRLGQTLSSEVRGQLIMATHSSDVLRGILEGTKGNVRILRISRQRDKNNVVTEASPDVIKELWTKPDLRYSNALEGIFHEQTIICEDDSDCRLINAIADHLAAGSTDQWQDTAYVPTGGKHAIPKVAAVLSQIGVPVKAVFDMDFLSEMDLVKNTVKAFGGSWELIEPLWKRVDAAVRSGNKPMSVAEIKSEILRLLNDSSDGGLPKGDVIEALKQDKPWISVKKYGSRGIPTGDAQRDFLALQNRLEDVGIYMVPVGEIEHFCPEIGSHGPKFVTKLLSSIPLSDSRLEALRIFVQKVHQGRHSK